MLSSTSISARRLRRCHHGFAEGKVILGFQSSLAFSQTGGLLLVEFLFNLSTKSPRRLAMAGPTPSRMRSSRSSVSRGAVVRYRIGVVEQCPLEAEASSFTFTLSRPSRLEALAQLLFKTWSESSAELFFTFGQQGFVPFLKRPISSSSISMNSAHALRLASSRGGAVAVLGCSPRKRSFEYKRRSYSS